MDRHLDWEGCFNVRDLGGIATADGRRVRRGAIVRSDGVHRLSAAGWAALVAHGVRTVIDLRNDDEIGSDAEPRPAGLTTVRIPLDDVADTEFWRHCWDNELDGSPLYYPSFLDRKPERCAAAVAAVARARPGGVVVHCGVGRDRTGLVSMLVLALVGVAPDDIAVDYALSTDRLPLFAWLGMEDQGPLIQEVLTRKNTSARAELVGLLTSIDVASVLRTGGLRDDELATLRARVLEPDAPGP